MIPFRDKTILFFAFLLFLLFETTHGQVIFNLVDNKLTTTDANFFNSTLSLKSCQEVLGPMTSILSINDPSYSSLVNCYFNSDKKLVVELGYGHQILDGTTPLFDAFGRTVYIIFVSTSSGCTLTSTMMQNYLLLQATECSRGLGMQKLNYTFTHTRNDLPNYPSFSGAMMVIPLSIDFKNLVSGYKPPAVPLSLVLKPSNSMVSKSSATRVLDGIIDYESGRCVGHDCYFQIFANETRGYTDTFYTKTTLSNSTRIFAELNHQMMRLDRNLVPVLSFATGVNYALETSTDAIVYGTYITVNFEKDCYYLTGGDKTHHKTQDLTITVQSSDLERCPLYCLKYRFNSDTQNSVNYRTYNASTLPVNGEFPVVVDFRTVGGNLPSLRTVVRVGDYSLLMRPVYFPIYQTVGQKITLQSIINSPTVTVSLISCKLIVASKTYDYTPESIQVQNFNTYSSILVKVTVEMIDASDPYKIRVFYNGGVTHYNDFQISPQSKPNLIGICKVSTVESKPIAFDTMFGIYCENHARIDIRSMKIQVLDDQSRSLLTLSNTKQTRIFSRLPKSATGKSNTVLFTLTDSFGAVFEFRDTYTAAMWSDTNLIEMVKYYIQSNQVRTYQTANNFAILLDILADYCKRNLLTSTDLTNVNLILRITIDEIIKIRDVVFHPTVYPEATELLFGLFRESANLASTLGLTEFDDKLNQILTFTITNGRKSSFSSTNDITFLYNLLTRNMEGNQTNSFNTSYIKNAINGLTTIASKNGQFKNDYFTYQSLTLYSSDETTSNEINLENGLVRVLFGSEVSNLVKSESQFNVETSLYKKQIKQNATSTLPIIATINLKRQDSSIVNVNGLQTPIIIYFNLNLINSTLANQFNNSQSRISCYYLNEITNMWDNDGLTSETVIENGQVVVKCSSNHLTSFTISSDAFNNVADSKSVVRNGLTPGEKAAIGVTISLFLLIVIIVIIIVIVIIICCRVKKGKSKSETKSIQESNPITNSYLELNPVSNSDSSGNLFISEYKSVREPSSSHLDTTSGTTSFTSDPASLGTATSSLMTSTNGNVIIGKKYEILEKIGQGAFGAVFKSKNLGYTGRPGEYQFVAIKKIQLSGLSEMNDKFKEAVNMFKIRNDYLVCLEDAVVDESTMSLYLVMQYYSQGDLDKFIKTKQLLPERILKQIIEQVSHGLKYLEEERNMLHRDIKPSNIFLSSYDGNNIKTVLSDFGLAKENNMMSSVSFAGTPYYMSPQALIGSKYSFNADIFSLGCTIFILITHDMSQSIAQLYFQNQANFSEVYSFITNSIHQKSSEYSEEFIQLLLQMMEFDPNKRPNASGVLKLLENL